MIPFDLAEPTSLSEAVKLLNPDDPTIRPIAGGTAIMLMMKAGVYSPEKLISLRKIESKYSSISADASGLKIGAMTTLATLERSADVKKVTPLITRTTLTLSNIRVRNVATIGGALAHGDPHMDLPPVLMALGASAVAIGPDGERVIKLEDLFTGYYETSLAKNELISEIRVPAPGKRHSAYIKFTAGSADDWPALGVAVSIDGDKNKIRSATVVVSAATEKAARMSDAEKVLSDATPDAPTLRRVGDAAAEQADILADIRGSVPYKRELIRVIVGRAVRQALELEGATH
jgi:aerobic carbon-monoxide dehydrogenase medium subunit